MKHDGLNLSLEWEDRAEEGKQRMINNTKDLWNSHRDTCKCKSSYVYIDTHTNTHTVNVELYYNEKDNGPICAPFMKHVLLYPAEYQIMVHKTLEL